MTKEELPGDELLRLKEAAERLNIKVKTLRNWIALRKIGHVRLGRAIRIPASEISGVIEDGYMPQADGPPPRRPQQPPKVVARSQPTKALPVDSEPSVDSGLPVDAELPVDSGLSANSELWAPIFTAPDMDPRVNEVLRPTTDPRMVQVGVGLLHRYEQECGPETDEPIRRGGSRGPSRFHRWVSAEAVRLERMRQESLDTWINGLKPGLYVVKGRNVKLMVIKE